MIADDVGGHRGEPRAERVVAGTRDRLRDARDDVGAALQGRDAGDDRQQPANQGATFAQGGEDAAHRAQISGEPIVPNDVCFESFDWRSVRAVRDELEGLGIGYGVQTDRPGRWYEYPGDPIARGVGAPVSHTTPA